MWLTPHKMAQVTPLMSHFSFKLVLLENDKRCIARIS
jgi:hypothetical protein